MPASLANPLAKLGRADEHLAALDGEARAYAGRNPYSVTDEVRADGLHVARARVSEQPPLRLGLILGDVLYQWRSALDNLVWQLVLLNGKTPPGRHNSFPIVGKRESIGEQLRGVRDTHADFIERLQPYPSRTGPPARALTAIDTYVTADKHRAIHPALAVVTNPEAAARSFRREPVSSEFAFEFDPVGFGKPLKDGMDIAHVRFFGQPPEAKPKMEGTLTVEVAFGDAGLRLEALPSIRREVHAVIDRFRVDFPGE